MSHDTRRRRIADIILSYQAQNIGLGDAVDAIGDVFEPAEAPQKVRGKTSAIIVSAVAVLLVGLDKRTPADALDLGEALSDELEARGILAVLEG